MNSNAYVGVGSNLGHSVEELQKAFTFLQSLSEEPLQKSSIWDSSPVGCPEGSADFFNAVVGLTLPKEMDAEAFLGLLQKYEVEAGRPMLHGHNTPRTIDLDILYFRGETLDTPRLKIPHPLATERRFVMEPWAEIAPELHLPVDSARETLREISDRLRRTHPEQKLSRL